MFQRIQTLFLFLAAASCILLFWFPYADYYHEMNGNYRFMVTGLQCMDPDPRVTTSFVFALPLLILTTGSAVLSLVIAFLYKKRPLQIKLVAVNILITVMTVILIFLFYTGKIQELTGITPSYGFGIFLPLISLAFLVLANRYIRHDQALVKSADRLR